MATPSVTALSLFAPLVASNTIFSARRASRGVEAMENNKPLFGAMNMTIAAAQIFKGVSAGSNAVLAMNPEFTTTVQSATENIKALSEKSKLVKCGGKLIKFVANNINPIICVAGAVKVLGSDDKVDAAARESLSLTSMFLAEGAYKSLIGMPRVIDGEMKIVGKFSPFIEKQVDAISDTNVVKNIIGKWVKKIPALKTLPGMSRGIGFAIASILGYKLGTVLGNVIIGEEAKN